MTEALTTTTPIIQNLKQGEGVSRACTIEDIEKRVLPARAEMLEHCLRPLGFHRRGGVAVAHCQFEKENPLRFYVMASGDIVINPHIVQQLGRPFRNAEGCMSFAEKSTLRGVTRYRVIIANFTQIMPDGKKIVHKNSRLSGLLALVMQHEIDHMNGRHLF